MKTAARTAGACLLVACAALRPSPDLRAYHGVEHPRPAPKVIFVRNATLWTQGPQGVLEGADLLIRDGTIVSVGRDLRAPEGAFVVDGAGKHVTPGLIDCHSHTAIRGGVNEGSNNVTAEVRIADVIDPTDVNLYRQLAGGLTAAHLLHGSANAIGGQDAVIKLHWTGRVEDLLLDDAPPGIKFALGENPKRSNFNLPGMQRRYPATRMGVMQSIREAFHRARDYAAEWKRYDALSPKARERRAPPRKDLQLDAIVEILEGRRRVHSHSYRQDEILALIRLAESFGVRVATFQHVLEGYKVADEIAAHGAGASTFSDWWAYKLEAYDAIPYNGALMHERGVVVSFNSDSSELARRLNLEAAKAVKYGGVPEQEALAFVTINAARQLGLDHRMGSLEKGKDADFVVWSGHPLSVYSVAEQTWVDGIREFDINTDRELRRKVEARRLELEAKVKAGGKKPSEASGEDAAPDQSREDTQAGAEAPPQAGARTGGGAGEEPLFTPRSIPYQPARGEAPVISILHATVHTLDGPPLQDATVSIRDGRIVALGERIPPLPDAEVVDATGLHLYPGLMDASTALGLIEISSVAGSVDIQEIGVFHPEINAAIAVNPDSELLPVTRANGITHVLTVPGGGMVSGTSTLIRLDGWTWEDLASANPVAMHIRWPSFRIRRFSYFGPPPSEEDQKKEREERLRKIRQFFRDARAYHTAKQAQGRGGAPLETDEAFEAMIPVLEGRVPVVVHAGEVRQIRSALEWAEEEPGIRLILAGSGDLWRVADTLRERSIPVILTGVLRLPSREDEPYDTAYREAARLHESGVRFCISTGGGSFGSANTRNLPYHAAMAAAFGLPREEAIRAVTRYPAEILGVGDSLGTVEVGKSASLILTDGDPLEIRTHVLRAWIDGRPVNLRDNRHWRLYEKYRGRPRVEARR